MISMAEWLAWEHFSLAKGFIVMRNTVKDILFEGAEDLGEQTAEGNQGYGAYGGASGGGNYNGYAGNNGGYAGGYGQGGQYAQGNRYSYGGVPRR